MSIALAVIFDFKYLAPGLVTVLDCFQKTSNDIYIYYLLNAHEKDAEAVKLIQYFVNQCDSSRIKFNIQKIDIPKYEIGYLSEACMYKLLLPEYIENENLVLVLDAGIILGRKFSHLIDSLEQMVEEKRDFVFSSHTNTSFDTSPNGGYFEGLVDFVPKIPYVNTMALLININNYKKFNLAERLLQFYEKYHHSIKSCEQDVLYCITKEDEFALMPNMSDRKGWFLGFSEQPKADGIYQKPISDLSNDELLDDCSHFKFFGPMKPWLPNCDAPERKFFTDKLIRLRDFIKSKNPTVDGLI